MASRITRREWGSGHVYDLDGKRVPGVTTIIGNALPKHALPNWYAKQAAQWAADHADLIDALGVDAWVKQATAAPRDVADKAANRGRDTHTHALELLAGETPNVADDALPFVKQAARFLDDWGAQEYLAERPCANTVYKYCGTFDLIAKLRDGSVWLLDYKTGSGPWNSHALQMAAYAACDIVQDTSGEDLQFPDIDRCGFVMLREDHYQFIPLKADPDRLVNYFYRCIDIAAFHKNTDGRDPKWEWLGTPISAGGVA